MRAGNRTVYGLVTGGRLEDTDFDIADAYQVSVNYELSWMSHSHGSAHPHVYARGAVRNINTPGGQITPSAADVGISCNILSGLTSGTGFGSVQVSGSGVDNSTLTLVFKYTVKTAG